MRLADFLAFTVGCSADPQSILSFSLAGLNGTRDWIRSHSKSHHVLVDGATCEGYDV